MGESDGYFALLAEVAAKGRIQGPMIHDARIIALCQLHGVRVLYSADRDFGRFSGVTVLNPLVNR